MSDETPRSRLLLVSLLGVVVLVVVIALIAVLARGSSRPLDEGTPEGVVQRYSQAVVDGDIPTALAYLVPEVAESCERIPPTSEDLRVTLLETTERDDTARVRVIVVTVYGSGPLGADEYESEEVFDLVEVDGEWLIQTVPWQLEVCTQGRSL